MALIRPRYETPDPPGVVGTYGDKAIAWAKRELKLKPSEWQAYVIRKALRYDAKGDLIHRVVLLSVGRQGGKSVIVRIIVGWLLDEGRMREPFREWTDILAAAHDAKQARIIYRGVYDDLTSIPRLIDASKGGRFGREAKLTELFGIRLGRLNFDTATSQPGSMRGKSVGFIPWDECLTQKDWEMWAALGPTQASQRSPQMFMTSTAGDLESVVLRKFYDDLVKQANGHDDPDTGFYGAWWQSEDPEAGLDWDQILQANPGLEDGRPSRAFVEHEYRTAPPEIWRRERLNHWQDTIAASAFGVGQWDAARVADPVPASAPMYTMGVAVGPDWERATIAIAAMRDDGKVGTAVYKDMRAAPGDALTAADVIGAVHQFPGFATLIGFESNSAGAPAFRRDRDENGWQWHELTPSGVTAACMDMAEMVQGGLLAVDDPLLDAQVSMAGRKAVGLEGAFRFARSVSTGPIDALLAATYASHLARFSSDIGVYIPA